MLKGILYWMTTVIILYCVESTDVALGYLPGVMAVTVLGLTLVVSALFTIFVYSGHFEIERWKGSSHYDELASDAVVDRRVLPWARWTAISALVIQLLLLTGVNGPVMAVLAMMVLAVDLVAAWMLMTKRFYKSNEDDGQA